VRHRDSSRHPHPALSHRERVLQSCLAASAADRGVAEAYVAAAAVFAALVAAIAAGLQLGAALLVAAGATDCAAVGRVLALAVAIGKRALAALNAVVRAVATAAAVAEHATQILQRAAGKFILALAMNLETAGALFELDLATRHHTPVASRARGREATGLPRLGRARRGRRAKRKPFHQYSTRHEELLSGWREAERRVVLLNAEKRDPSLFPAKDP
jgi:hypothetical protein